MICEKCKSENIKFVEDRSPWTFPFKAKIICWAILIALIIICVGLLFVNFIAAIITFFVTFGIFACALKVMVEYQNNRRGRTRTKCICKNCGYIWYLN